MLDNSTFSTPPPLIIIAQSLILHGAKKSQHVISFFAIPYSAYPCESIYVNETKKNSKRKGTNRACGLIPAVSALLFSRDCRGPSHHNIGHFLLLQDLDYFCRKDCSRCSSNLLIPGQKMKRYIPTVTGSSGTSLLWHFPCRNEKRPMCQEFLMVGGGLKWRKGERGCSGEGEKLGRQRDSIYFARPFLISP